MKIISIAHFPAWKRNLIRPIYLFWWTAAPFVVDRLPWFAAKPLMNLLFGEEIYYDLMHGAVLGLS